ncbi:MAG: glutamate-5-semialdehyde dehydrogenase [Oscillospiraceae bacterium]|nr:glutamate-5-semialdehyde dehydrogenase [Oscillospiraceae bacterium]
MTDIKELCAAAKRASRLLMTAGTEQKNAALDAMAQALENNCGLILEANAADVRAAREKGTRENLIDRLSLDEKRVKAMADGLRQVALLPDPVGGFDSVTTRPNGLLIGKKRVPLGVIGIIYEARPNVTADAAALCLKSGNACVLRGGSEAINSNKAIAAVMRVAIGEAGLPEDAVCLVSDTSRENAAAMMKMNEYIDVLIPRGGAGLIRTVVESASVPVIETGTGNCHVYIDDFADLKMGAEIIYNAKCSRPSVCNAAESLLVSEKVADSFLPMAKALLDQKNVELRGDEKTRAILGDSVIPATEEDYYTEFLDYILSVKVVSGIDEAIDFINEHSTGHSECIVTENYNNALRFQNEIDSAAVYVNASTRFTDGGEFGFGAEIGISTQKLHARGPVGLMGLTSCKYVILGQGQIR